jgi:riboflavin synthase
VFTGIVEEVGKVRRLDSRPTGARLEVGCRRVLEDAKLGCSIAVSGVCLTASDLRAESFTADLAPETLLRTSLGDLIPGSEVNLERPLAVGDRLSGHIMQGHVDGTAEFLSLDHLGDGNWWLKVKVTEELDRYLVWKGSVALDGISLTVASLTDRVLGVTIVPHTYENTALRGKRPGDRVNVECDVLAKYVEKLMERVERAPIGLTVERLKELGY